MPNPPFQPTALPPLRAVRSAAELNRSAFLMITFLQVYFWLMVAYLLISLMGKCFMAKKIGAAGFAISMWIEEVVSYALLMVGLIGVYGHIHATPIFSAVFWQGFVVVFSLFASLQYFMPKIRLLREAKGGIAVFAAYVVGVLLLVPMFVAIVIYGFQSSALWA